MANLGMVGVAHTRISVPRTKLIKRRMSLVRGTDTAFPTGYSAPQSSSDLVYRILGSIPNSAGTMVLWLSFSLST